MFDSLKRLLVSFTLVTSLLAAERPPNIIYILVDDAGYGDFSCYGQKKFQTPHIDRLAAEGIKFTQHYSGSTVCAPTRSALMTGLHTGHTPIRGNADVKDEEGRKLGQTPLPASSVTIAEVLKKKGYATGAFGKWGLGHPGSEGDPLNQGFDRFYGYNCQWNAHTYYPTWLYDDTKKITLDGKTYTPPLIMQEAVKWIREKKDEPFFAFLPLTPPHAAMHIPEKWAGPFRKKFPQFEDKVATYGDNPPFPTNPAAQFAGMMTLIDENVGEVMALLKELGIDENTLVFFTSDNGPHLEGGHMPNFFDSNGPFKGHKRSLTEGGIRVPLIARWPGKIKAGSISDHVSAQWDMMPTLAKLIGEKLPTPTDGISLLPTLTGGEQAQHDYLYWEFPSIGGRRAVRFGKDLRWKAVQYKMMNNPKAPVQIYDLQTDPGEERDLSAEHPKLVAEAHEIFKKAHSKSDRFPFHWEK